MRLPFTAKVDAWDAALDFYERTHLIWLDHSLALVLFEREHPENWNGHPEHDRLDKVSGDWCHSDAVALRALMRVPAPNVSAALLKLDLAVENGEEDGCSAALDDLRRLTGIARPDINAFRRAQ